MAANPCAIDRAEKDRLDMEDESEFRSWWISNRERVLKADDEIYGDALANAFSERRVAIQLVRLFRDGDYFALGELMGDYADAQISEKATDDYNERQRELEP